MPLTTTSASAAAGAAGAPKRGVPVFVPSGAPAAEAPESGEDSKASSDVGSPSPSRSASPKAGRSPSHYQAQGHPSRRSEAHDSRSLYKAIGDRRKGSGPSGDGRRRCRRGASPAAEPGSPGRPGRSRSLARCRTPARTSGGQHRPAVRECWFGWRCNKPLCGFIHPRGRRIDEEKQARQERRQRHRSPPRASSPASSRSSSSKRRSRKPGHARGTRQPAAAPAQAPAKAHSRSASPASSRSSSASPRSSASKRSAAPGQRPEAPKAKGPSSFRTFVLRELDDNAAPEVAIAKYEEHKRSFVRLRMEALRGTGLFFDLYHPVAVTRRYDLRVCTAQLAAEAFLQDLGQGRFGGLCLRALSAGAPTCPTAGHLQPPHFAFDPDTHALLLGGIPAAASAWALCDLIAACPGLATMAWGKPASATADRTLRARFASAEQVRAACEVLAEAPPQGGYKLQPVLLNPAAQLSALVVPPEMSHPNRIQKDEALSAEVVRKLNALVGMSWEQTEALLGRQMAAEAKLDLQVLYLRRVHHFCFYAASWCEDEWELRNRCGTAAVRSGGGGPAEPTGEGDWAQAHDERLQRFLAAAELPRPSPPDGCDERLLAEASALCEEKTLQVAEGKFRCQVCAKHFKGPDYVHKHLRKAHTDLFEAIQRKAHDDAAEAAFLADPLPEDTGK